MDIIGERDTSRVYRTLNWETKDYLFARVISDQEVQNIGLDYLNNGPGKSANWFSLMYDRVFDICSEADVDAESHPNWVRVAIGGTLKYLRGEDLRENTDGEK